MLNYFKIKYFLYISLFLLMLFQFGCSVNKPILTVPIPFHFINKPIFPDYIISAMGESGREDINNEVLNNMSINVARWQDITIIEKNYSAVPEGAITSIEKRLSAKRSAYSKGVESIAKKISQLTLTDSGTLGSYLLKNPDALNKVNQIVLKSEIKEVQYDNDGSVTLTIALNLKALEDIVDKKPTKYQKVLVDNKYSSGYKMLTDKIAENKAIGALFQNVLEFKVDDEKSINDFILENRIDNNELRGLIINSHNVKNKYVDGKSVVLVEFNVGKINKIMKTPEK